ncbi:MAG TPA: hypothetical protein VFA45_25920 [Actinomycetes bacterium]|jgi:photosystem II stability/assembly factor-like uncharacterized protein|nr:hypothetical protein [Actinomycetes bacterium]
MHGFPTCPSIPTRSRSARSRRTLALTVIAALALAGCVRASGSEPPGVKGPPRRTIFGPVRAAQLVTATRGWALTPKGLAWTDDGGTTWRDITPRASALGVRGVFFLDRMHGWVVASSGRAGSDVALGAFRTADGGRTWTSARVARPSAANADAYSGPAWVRFVDARHGWILVKDVSSSNFSFGRLYRTKDGGRSWTELEAPLGDPVTFVDQQTGWTAGGPAGDRLFVSRDAGRTWKRQKVQAPPGTAGERIAYALPVEAGAALVLPVTLTAGTRATVAWYLSRDAGRSWRLANRVETADQLSPGVRVPVAVAGSDTWLSMLPSSRRLVRLRHDGATLAVQAPASAPAGVQELEFATETVGWALAASGTCPPGGPCAPGRVLFRTSDGGSSWREVTVL